MSASILDTIGNTPLVRLQKLNTNPLVEVYVKLEFLNPSGSIKDRIAKYMIEAFEREGKLTPGRPGIVVENSSGNTGAGVAMICGLRGYQSILVVPNKCSEEKRAALKAFGARLIVCPPGVTAEHPHHYEAVAKSLVESIPHAVRLDQYNNQLNVEAHYSTTGPEIWRQTDGRVNVFVAGASTGGTISGISRYLKEQNNAVRVVLADVRGSVLLNMVRSGEFVRTSGASQIEGIGKDYPVACMHFNAVDDAVLVNDRDAFRVARLMAREEGILCGISSGANVHACLELARSATVPTVIVTVLPDGGAKYFSKVFAPQWLLDHQLIDEEEARDMRHEDTVHDIARLASEFNQLLTPTSTATTTTSAAAAATTSTPTS
eukprot:gnl/Spiro4/9056_TR4774_c0_g1_i1.p1 gnl/Spiro4/9056_TR4774_c0_g1~~gnl/Spiro4/9056_TR4774_c0_g1_i1.p1  ORF type:complete len:393 (-),score=123.63 gnl/Spiro4/9056_TR4774_c0_g1_i1:249-1376(-)